MSSSTFEMPLKNRRLHHIWHIIFTIGKHLQRKCTFKNNNLPISKYKIPILAILFLTFVIH